MKTLGQVAYEAYCNSSNGKSLISGAPLPSWDAQKRDIQLAWEAAASAAVMASRESIFEVCAMCGKPQMNCDCEGPFTPAPRLLKPIA